MKKKKLKKIAKLIFNEFNLLKKGVVKSERVDYVPYNEEVSKKTKNLIIELIKYDESVRINISEDSFNISTSDITTIKKPSSPNRFVANEDNYLEICVFKDEGFVINLAYIKRTSYEDKDIYNQLFELVSERVMENNKENFNKIWDRVVKDSGIIRDNNLNKLFDE